MSLSKRLFCFSFFVRMTSETAKRLLYLSENMFKYIQNDSDSPFSRVFGLSNRSKIIFSSTFTKQTSIDQNTFTESKRTDNDNDKLSKREAILFRKYCQIDKSSSFSSVLSTSNPTQTQIVVSNKTAHRISLSINIFFCVYVVVMIARRLLISAFVTTSSSTTATARTATTTAFSRSIPAFYYVPSRPLVPSITTRTATTSSSRRTMASSSSPSTFEESKNPMGLKQLFDDDSSTYTYLLWDEQTKDAILVDPVDIQVDRDLSEVQSLGLNLIYGWYVYKQKQKNDVYDAGMLRIRSIENRLWLS